MLERSLTIQDKYDLVKARQLVREMSIEMGYSIVNQTKLITATSELTRNALMYAKTGKLCVKEIANEDKIGILIVVTDEGPGIKDLDLVLKDIGYSTSGGLGKGIPGTRRLMDEFYINSIIGKGTEVKIIKWKS